MVALLVCPPGMRCSINHCTALQVGGSLPWPPTAIAVSSWLLTGKCHTGSLPLLFQCCLVPTAQPGTVAHRAESADPPNGPSAPLTRAFPRPSRNLPVEPVPARLILRSFPSLLALSAMAILAFQPHLTWVFAPSTLRRHPSSTHLSISLGSCQGLKSCILKECSQIDQRCLV